MTDPATATAHAVETRWLVDHVNGYAIPLDKVTHFERRTAEDRVRVYFTSFGYVDLDGMDFDQLTEQLVLNL